ncbi:hypothetical protein K443DRAFT_90849 [Laccaria amethystina LaAM-08-1]|uniref:Uncharacterized protein n=1 Tax=Laccaria amethystina LaAM-08-1 TaxID=1095629 RepID=A0A0C9X0X0_9AGAR|nr:hypothetical protein K443DRAFT_90849 [Laccaria amethystina LaAM-08-1]
MLHFESPENDLWNASGIRKLKRWLFRWFRIGRRNPYILLRVLSPATSTCPRH